MISTDKNQSYTKFGQELAYQEILSKLKSDRAQLIDIREKSEWNHSHFACAEHIPLSDLNQGIGIDRLKELKERKKIYLHCRSGSRVKAAELLLGKYGCTEFTILPDSMFYLMQKGFTLL